MKSIAENTKTVQSVVDAVHRIEKLTQADWKAAASEIGLSTGLPVEHGPFPKLHFQCGKLADRELYELAAERVESDPELNDRIEVEKYLRPLQVEIAQRCLISKTAVTPELVKEIFKVAKDLAKSALVDRTYLFPVYGLNAPQLKEFNLGAALFTQTKLFFERSQVDWQRSVASSLAKWQTGGDISEEGKRHAEGLFGSSKEHYERFGWIASVEVRQADPAVAWKRARKLLEDSFNILRLLIPSRRGQFVGLPDERPSLQSEAWIERLPGGEFEASLSSNWIEPHAEEGYLEGMKQRAPQIGFIESAVRKQQNWQPLEAIETRILTSLSWFGEAWKEQSPLPKLVKFAISLESLIMTGDKEGLTELLAERVAFLCGANIGERKQLFGEVRSVYRARSDAVHGGIADKDSTLPELNRTAEKLAMFSLLCCADLFPCFLGIKGQKQALADFFTNLKLGGVQEAIKAVHAAQAAASKP